jgi:membrane-associated protease RseP (regulator of RpoE activity)
MTTVFAFVLLLSTLIFVHELGHFLVAKACGVRVLKFSLGFGPPIGIGRHRLSWTRGHTEYVVAWFPLGGFVKMLGESLEEMGDPAMIAHPEETLNGRPTWQKLAIVFAGPAMNLLLPVVVFMATLAVGMPRPLPVIGTIEPASPAEQAGLRPGDRITAAGGVPVEWWEDFDAVVRSRADAPLQVAYERDGEPAVASLEIVSRSSLALRRARGPGFELPRRPGGAPLRRSGRGRGRCAHRNLAGAGDRLRGGARRCPAVGAPRRGRGGPDPRTDGPRPRLRGGPRRHPRQRARGWCGRGQARRARRPGGR